MDFSVPKKVSEEIIRFKEFIKSNVTSELSQWYQDRQIPLGFFQAMGKGGWYGIHQSKGQLVRGSALREALLAEDPDRLMRPMRHEPMFEVAGAAGYDWERCNDDRPTQRVRLDDPTWPLGRIDWFFARGLDCRDPVTIPAVGEHGDPISDHDALAVTIGLTR